MTVFLLILKIIGIALLVIIGIILLLLLIILYVPVRYKITARIPEDDIKCSNGSAYIRYLHLVRLWLTYNNKEFDYKVKVLCFNINLDNKVHPEVKVQPEVKVHQEVKVDEPDTSKNVTTGKNKTDKNDKKDKDKKYKKSKKSKTKKVKAKKPKKDLGKLWKNIKFYFKMLKDENNKNAFRHCMSRLKKLLKHYMPRKAKGYVQYGLTDPANTGLITGFLSIFPFMYKSEFKVNPDFNFDRNYICGDLNIKGHIRAVHLLNASISIYFNKDVKRFIKLMKKHKLKEE